jgi:hypothetical protein
VVGRQRGARQADDEERGVPAAEEGSVTALLARRRRRRGVKHRAPDKKGGINEERNGVLVAFSRVKGD